MMSYLWSRARLHHLLRAVAIVGHSHPTRAFLIWQILEVHHDDGERYYTVVLSQPAGSDSNVRAAKASRLKARSEPQIFISRHRYTDFEKLHSQLTRHAAEAPSPAAPSPMRPSPAKPAGFSSPSKSGATLRLPPLPGKNSKRSALGLEARRSALQAWLERVVAEPSAWSEELRIFLGLASEPPTSVVISAGAMTQDILWILERMHHRDCGLRTEPSGTFRGAQLVEWLMGQALANSREEAARTAESMRVRGLIESAEGPAAFADGKTKYRFVADSDRGSALEPLAAPPAPGNPFDF